MKATEYEFEPLPGLPAQLPAGETILWQGAPAWRSLARRVFHADKVAAYFCLLALWRAGAAFADGRSGAEAAGSCLWLVPPAAAAIGLLVLLAWLTARTTIYTITSRRVVMRYGIAFPATVNLPFRAVASADLKRYPDGTGDIPLALMGPDAIAYLYLWPRTTLAPQVATADAPRRSRGGTGSWRSGASARVVRRRGRREERRYPRSRNDGGDALSGRGGVNGRRT